MNGDFPRKSWIAAVVGLMVLVGLAAGFTSYQAGVSRGLALQPPPPVVAAPPNAGAPQGSAPAPYYYGRYRGYRGWGWGGFGFFGGLFSILIWIFVIRMIVRALFGWGWGCGWRRRYWGGRYGYGLHPDDFDEWHRRAHDRMREAPPTTA